jgi:hypothetical protein
VPLLPGDVLGRVLAKFSVGELHAVSGVDRSFRDAAQTVQTAKPHVRLLELLRQNRSDEAGRYVDARHAASDSITALVLPVMHMAVDMERYRPCLPALVELLSRLVASGAAKGPGHDQKAEDAATALLDGMFSAIQQGMHRTAKSIWSRCGDALRVRTGLEFRQGRGACGTQQGPDPPGWASASRGHDPIASDWVYFCDPERQIG